LTLPPGRCAPPMNVASLYAISYPAESQDLSLIEIVWDAIGRSINTPKPLPHTTQKLCENVGAASQNSIRNLYNSRLRRLACCSITKHYTYPHILDITSSRHSPLVEGFRP
uniref:Uncharacterized protein n=1 Tax=Astyanax mexicanus TaxID=7994 RepID=A0A3B1IFV2_ASTMX